ncbi:hypothetical protein DFJ73DRAFT_960227 [Zopfochytrium polystomum]|nr:hypothetical protein DFJ73DRAFT_960227 [Zopfochytrium polystomum]
MVYPKMDFSKIEKMEQLHFPQLRGKNCSLADRNRHSNRQEAFSIGQRAITITTTINQPVNPPSCDNLPFESAVPIGRKPFPIDQRAFSTDRRQLLASSPAIDDQPPPCDNLPFETAIPIGEKPFPSNQRAFSIDRPRQLLASSPTVVDPPSCDNLPFETAIPIGEKPFQSVNEPFPSIDDSCLLQVQPSIDHPIPIGEKPFSIDQRAFSIDRRRQLLASSPAIDDQPSCTIARQLAVRKRPSNRQEAFSIRSTSLHQPPPPPTTTHHQLLASSPASEKTFPIDQRAFSTDRRQPLASSPAVVDQPSSTVVRQLAVPNRHSNRQEAFPTDQRAFSINRQRQALASSPTVVDPPSCDNLPFETAIRIGEKPFPSDQPAFSTDRPRQLLASSPTVVDPPPCDNLPFESAIPIGEKPFAPTNEPFSSIVNDSCLLQVQPSSIHRPSTSCDNLPFETAIRIGEKPFPSDQPAFSTDRPRQLLASSPTVVDPPSRDNLPFETAIPISEKPLPPTNEPFRSIDHDSCLLQVQPSIDHPACFKSNRRGSTVARQLAVRNRDSNKREASPTDQRAFSIDRPRQLLASSPAVNRPPCDNLPFESAIPIGKKPFQSVNEPFPSISNRRGSTVARQLAVRNRDSNKREASPTDQRAFSIDRPRQLLASSPAVNRPPCDNLPFESAIPIGKKPFQSVNEPFPSIVNDSCLLQVQPSSIHRPSTSCDNFPFESDVPIGKKPFPTDQRAFSIDRQRQPLASSPTVVDPPSCDNLPFESAIPIGKKPFPSDQRAFTTTTTTNHQLLAASPASLRSEGQKPPPFQRARPGCERGTVAQPLLPPPPLLYMSGPENWAFWS